MQSDDPVVEDMVASSDPIASQSRSFSSEDKKTARPRPNILLGVKLTGCLVALESYTAARHAVCKDLPGYEERSGRMSCLLP